MLLNTARLLLRPVETEDAALLVDLDSDPEVMRFVSGGPATPPAVITDSVIPRMQAQQREYGTGMWVAFDAATAHDRTDRSESAFTGWVQLRTPRHSRSGELELSYRLRRAAWGRGFAREASAALVAVMFTSTPVRRIFAGTDVDHLASRRVMEALGMRLAADSDPAALTGPGASVEYELLREQWCAGRGRGGRVIKTSGSASTSGMTA